MKKPNARSIRRCLFACLFVYLFVVGAVKSFSNSGTEEGEVWIVCARAVSVIRLSSLLSFLVMVVFLFICLFVYLFLFCVNS